MIDALQKQQHRFVEAVVDGETILMDADNGRFYGLKAPAATIWKLIDGTRSNTAIIEALGEAYDGLSETIERDLDIFVNRLVEIGFVT